MPDLFGPLNALDIRLFQVLNNAGSERWDPLMLFLSDSLVWWYLGGAVTLIFCLSGQKRLIFRWATLLLALGLNDLTTTHLMKERIQRPRPCHQLAPIRLVPTDCGGRNGLPSNHAANGTAITVSLGLLFGWKIGTPALVIALLVGYSRIYLGVHFPFDVLLGFLWGTGIAFLVSGWGFRRARRRFPAWLGEP